MSKIHYLDSTPDTVRFGIFDAEFPPVLKVASGDCVVVACVSGGPEVMPDPSGPYRIPHALAAIHAAQLPRMGPHILTGPIEIEDAEPGEDDPVMGPVHSFFFPLRSPITTPGRPIMAA